MTIPKKGAIDVTARPTIYVPLNQDSRGYFTLLVRTSQEEHAIRSTLFSAIHGFDANLICSRRIVDVIAHLGDPVKRLPAQPKSRRKRVEPHT